MLPHADHQPSATLALARRRGLYFQPARNGPVSDSCKHCLEGYCFQQCCNSGLELRLLRLLRRPVAHRHLLYRYTVVQNLRVLRH